MAIVQRHESPDGLLRLLIDRQGDDVMVGFEGFEWHTHADLLTLTYDSTEDDAVANFVRDILEDKAVVVVARVANEVREVWITDDPAKEWKYVAEGEVIELRYWSGATWSVA